MKKSKILSLCTIVLVVVFGVVGYAKAQMPVPASNAKVVIVNSPILELIYDSAQKESLLKATFNLAVSAVNSDLNLYTDMADIRLLDAKGIQAPGNLVVTAIGVDKKTDAYGRNYTTVKEGETISMSMILTANPKQLFAGSYHVILNNIYAFGSDIDNKAYVTVPSNQTNEKIIIGEVSPYLSGFGSNPPFVSGQSIVVNGERLSIDNIYIDGIALTTGSKGGDTSIGFVLPKLLDGQHYLYVSNSTGASNRLGFEVKSLTSCYVFSVNLQLGSTGADVVALQTLLINKGYAISDLSSTGAYQKGYFGRSTYEAVKKYQASKGIPSTGFVGPLTRAALNAECTTSSLTVLSPNGGESWQKQTVQTIKWQDNTIPPACPVGTTCVIPPKSYNIFLSKYYPPCTTNICPAYVVTAPYTIAKNVTGTSYSWNVGYLVDLYNDLAPDGAYTVQVCQTEKRVCDNSNSYFKIYTTSTYPSIIVATPKDGEDWQVGMQYKIIWTDSREKGVTQRYVITLAGSNGKDLIADNLSASTYCQGSTCYFGWSPTTASTNNQISIYDVANDPNGTIIGRSNFFDIRLGSTIPSISLTSKYIGVKEGYHFYTYTVSSKQLFNLLTFKAECDSFQIDVSIKAGGNCGELLTNGFSSTTNYSLDIGYKVKDGNAHTVGFSVTAKMNSDVVGSDKDVITVNGNNTQSSLTVSLLSSPSNVSVYPSKSYNVAAYNVKSSSENTWIKKITFDFDTRLWLYANSITIKDDAGAQVAYKPITAADFVELSPGLYRLSMEAIYGYIVPINQSKNLNVYINFLSSTQYSSTKINILQTQIGFSGSDGVYKTQTNIGGSRAFSYVNNIVTPPIITVYPGFYIYFDKSEYLSSDSVIVTMKRADGSTVEYPVDIYVGGINGEKVKIKTNVLVGQSQNFSFRIDQQTVYSGAGSYQILLCDAGQVCNGGVNTNAAGFNVITPIVPLVCPVGYTCTTAGASYACPAGFTCTQVTYNCPSGYTCTTNQATSITPTASPSITASPTTVVAGQPVTLTWNWPGATYCRASGGQSDYAWQGLEQPPANKATSGSKIITPIWPTALTPMQIQSGKITVNYRLYCSGMPGTTGTASIDTNITVTNPNAVTVPVSYSDTPNLFANIWDAVNEYLRGNPAQ